MDSSSDNTVPASLSAKPSCEFERRENVDARRAIHAMEDALFDPEASDKLFQVLIRQLAEVTQADAGVCFVSGEHAEFPIFPNTTLTPIFGKDTPNFVNNRVLTSWVGQKNVLTSPAYYNYPIPSSTAALLKDPDNVSSMMILPIRLSFELRAICIFANKNESFSAANLRTVRPILDAAICTLQTAETVRGNFTGLDKNLANNRYLSSLISSSPIGVIVVDQNACIVLSNPISQDIFDVESVSNDQHERISLAGRNINEFFPSYTAFFQWSNQHDKLNQFDDTHAPRLWKQQEAYRTDGSICIVNLTLFRFTIDSNRYTTLQIQDITSFQSKTEEYKRTSQQLNALTQLAPVGIIHVTLDWECIFANDKWTEFSGFSQADSAGRNWINAIHPSDVSELLLALRDSLQSGTDYNQEVRLVSPMGSTKWLDVSIRILFDLDGDVEGFLATFNDITERFVNQEKLRHIAEYDGLTGLATRLLLQDRLQQAFYDSERDASTISIFFLDLDGFKNVNDSLGHDVGDLLLQQVADRLVNVLRKNDTIARFGGDEFVVMLGHADHISEVITVANKVINVIAKPYDIENKEVFITTSLGIAQGTNDNSSPEILLKNADFALYSAKKAGKNKFQMFNEALEANTNARLTLLNELRTGLQRDKFELHYQPITDAGTGHIIGYEALLRFHNIEKKLISPEVFISLLEDNNLIVDVGCWVIDEVCRQMAQWQKHSNFPKHAYISFNVSAKQLLNHDIVSHIDKACKLNRVNPSCLVMEITESVIINKPKEVRVILDKIKTLSVRLALDDFGTGYSSLSYLQNFPFDIIKIDKSFVDDLSENSNNRKIIQAIIALATSFELMVIAEGVETKFAKDTVTEMGAMAIQGYFICKPQPSQVTILFLDSYQLGV